MQQTIRNRNYDTPQETAIVSDFGYSYVKWSSVFGGWLLAAATAMILYTVGAAIGISAINFTDLDALSKKTVFLSAFWMLVTWTVSLYLGSYFASSISNDGTKRSGVLHGIGVWALSTILTALVGAAGIGTTAAVGISAAGIAAEASDGQNVSKGFQVQIKDAINGFAGEADSNAAKAVQDLDAKTIGIISADVLRGDQNAAIDSLAYHTSLTREEAVEVVTGMDAQIQEAKIKAKQAADKAAAFSTAALAAGVVISLLALLAAISGGSAGARMHLTAVETRTV